MSHLDESAKRALSPKWKKPGDVMKKLYMKKRKNSSWSLPFAQSNDADASTPKPSINRNKNPFIKKQLNAAVLEKDKKRILSLNNETLNHFSDIHNDRSSLSSLFDANSDEHNETNNSLLDFVYLNEDSFMGLLNVNPYKSDAAVQFRKTLLPVDWTLKVKARFLSPSSFSWCARIKGSEEATAISKAARCLKNDETPENFCVELGKHLVYWQHPYIPWLNLFPRYGADSAFVSLPSDESIIPESAQSSLYDSWVIAFRSVYQLLRNNLCPYFYVCSQQYSALFRSSEITRSEVDCVLTPTSLGFRKALTAEGITYSMPLQKQNGSAEKSDAPTDSVKANGALNTRLSVSTSVHLFEGKENHDLSRCDEIEGSGDWSQEDAESDEENWRNISENLSFKKSRSLIAATTEDGLPNTAILIEGLANTQLLFNHLLNSRNSIATSGRQAGMPPTILSPVSFNSATLRKLDCRAGIAKIKNNSRKSSKVAAGTKTDQGKQHFSFDVSGPIMPHHLNGIVSLLDTTQESGDYSCSFGTYMYTGPFNAPCGTPRNCENEEKSEANDFIQNFVNRYDFKANPVSMRKMSALNRTYDWEM